MTFIPDWKITDDGWPVLALAGIVTILTSMIFLPLGCFFLGIMMWLRMGFGCQTGKPKPMTRSSMHRQMVLFLILKLINSLIVLLVMMPRPPNASPFKRV